VNRSRFDTLMSRSCKVCTGLEGVVADVTKKSSGESSGGVDEWNLFVSIMFDEKLRNISFIA